MERLKNYFDNLEQRCFLYFTNISKKISLKVHFSKKKYIKLNKSNYYYKDLPYNSLCPCVMTNIQNPTT